MINKLTAILGVLCIALMIAVGIKHQQLIEANQTISKQEKQLKDLYSQVNELTLQYVGIVKRLQQHGN